MPDELADSQPRQPFVREGAAALQGREEAARRIQVQAIRPLAEAGAEGGSGMGRGLQATSVPHSFRANQATARRGIHPPPHSPPPVMWTASRTGTRITS